MKFLAMKTLEMATTIPEPRSVDFERPLGGLERFLWLTDQNRPVHFVMAAHLEGRTTIPGWRVALDAVQRRHPLLGDQLGKSKQPRRGEIRCEVGRLGFETGAGPSGA